MVDSRAASELCTSDTAVLFLSSFIPFTFFSFLSLWLSWKLAAINILNTSENGIIVYMPSFSFLTFSTTA